MRHRRSFDLAIKGLITSYDSQFSPQTQVIPGRNGLDLSNFNRFQTLLTAAETYLSLGYAVIPLNGDLDPARPKVAACAWSLYQRQRPALTDLQTWFSEAGIGGALGIVTGGISRLVVLDFDSAAAFSDFSRRYPDLLETRTVRSAGRALPHLYFRLPQGLHIASQKTIGVDLLSDGRYVVAPPSTINGQAYTLTRGGMPRTLTDHDIRRLNTFLTTYKEATPKASPLSVGAHGCAPLQNVSPVDFVSLPPPFTGEGWGGGSETASSPPTKTTRADLHGLYTYWLTKGGRNDALFRTALHARDHGWNETQTRRALITLHTTSVGAHDDRAHSRAPLQTNAHMGGGLDSLRQREAAATIHSAFSRPARKPKMVRQPNAIANTAREWLMQNHLTYVIRTLEGLMRLGYQSGQVFTADDAITALKGIVGRDSIYKALNTLAPNGKPIFRRKSPSALPPASKEAANIKSGLKTKKCFFVTEQKSGLIKKGRKHRLYVLPTNRDLCRLLKVKLSGSDPLTRDDLASARQTRMALHRELIKRRPAEYTRAWLAGRLGVSRRTLDAYNTLIPIQRTATYLTTPLSWSSLDRLPLDEPMAGAYIETLYGKKYPALRSIAGHLMAKGTFIRLQQRVGNYYWYGTDQPPMPEKTAVEAPDHPFRISALPPVLMRENPAPSHTIPVGAHGGAPLPPAFPPAPTSSPAIPPPFTGEGWGGGSPASTKIISERGEKVPKSDYRKPLPDATYEALAQRVYTCVNGRTAESARQLSLSNARRLAATYSDQAIRQAIQRFESRAKLANPTGFFVSLLRSEGRLQPQVNKKGKA